MKCYKKNNILMKKENKMNKELLNYKKLMLINIMLENGYNKIVDLELLKTVKALKDGGVK